MSQKDYYAVLGVAKDATQDQIKRAYRKMAQAYHPDVNKSEEAPARMKSINEAYDTLGDATKRANYDRFGANGPRYAGYGQGNPYQGQGGATGYSTFEDIMAEFMRQQQRQQQYYQNQNQGRKNVYVRRVSVIDLFFRFIAFSFLMRIIMSVFAFIF